ncbi:MAG: thiolase family protein [Herbiconiux sp.]|uniref:thiolase family protein n=1 Tax=Herbiconiux sp. TaxID=1871186 RepID=UPI0011F7807C|nr:thiolase family protein [Herbiconiux sp.]TAJ46933.1 MAG: thiolase family protein [Herbiconiux sp.]
MADRTGRAAILGVADSALGKLPDRTPLDIAAEVALAACADAGIALDRIDGVLVNPPMVDGFSRHALALAEYLGISEQLTHASTVALGGAAAIVAVHEALSLVESGRCSAVLVAFADTPRTGQDRSSSVESFARMRHPLWEQPFGMMNVSAYGLLASAYLARFSLDEDALTVIPPVFRQNASTNPAAVYRTPLSVEDVRASRLVSDPLHLLECSPISDGGAAIVIGRAGAGRREVAMLGCGQGYRYDSVSFAGDLSTTGAGLSGARCYADSGLTATDADVALIYDSYSITVAMEMEELGICPPGTAPRFVADGGISMDGRIPVNPHGGLLSHAHCGGAAGIHHVTEAVRQLSGDAVNQVAGARTALLHAEGGIVSANATAILST